MEKFDYEKAVEELEMIAARVEDPMTGISDIERYVNRTKELVGACRNWLRGTRESLDEII